ncbi:hypothetical protein [Neogemmobacter tilapiae]|uniref:Uncharacterized protein n=1 Tax=Neogemmobacter tilapiae TaxID=875041 RepID=A0A918WJB7_9RHOB|nr:hypothetical protein [Gemmobacter tilapiae]GHC48183.1 hypothetical protein GCM10007315_07680 [Gemmobacter tilapiae]
MKKFLLAVTLVLAGPAQAFMAENDVRVAAMDGGQFLVGPVPGMGAAASWCAAGDYALRKLNLAPTDRIWRVSVPPRKQGEGVVFALTGDGASPKTGLVRIPDDGSMTVAGAQALCWALNFE